LPPPSGADLKPGAWVAPSRGICFGPGLPAAAARRFGDGGSSAANVAVDDPPSRETIYDQQDHRMTVGVRRDHA
jgi:hypothetical protein